MTDPKIPATEHICGYFGSLYQQILVFRVKDGPLFYVLLVPDEEQRFHLYGKDAAVVPRTDGGITDVVCQGQKYRFRCWAVSRANYVSESMDVARVATAGR